MHVCVFSWNVCRICECVCVCVQTRVVTLPAQCQKWKIYHDFVQVSNQVLESREEKFTRLPKLVITLVRCTSLAKGNVRVDKQISKPPLAARFQVSNVFICSFENCRCSCMSFTSKKNLTRQNQKIAREKKSNQSKHKSNDEKI